MNTVKNQFLHYGDLIAKLTQFKEGSDSEPNSRLREVFAELKALVDQSIQEMQVSANYTLQKDKPGELPDTDPVTYLSSNDNALKQEIENLRMRMVSVLVMGRRVHSQIHEGQLPEIFGALITTRSGITYGNVAGYCTVLLPSFDDPNQELLFGSDMLDVFDATMKTQGLVVDCSAVKRLPLMVQAVLLGYRHTLTVKGKDFSIVWLHMNAVDAHLRANAEQVFKGEFIGEYLFSKRE